VTRLTKGAVVAKLVKDVSKDYLDDGGKNEMLSSWNDTQKPVFSRIWPMSEIRRCMTAAIQQEF
jgi:hypothetical protein